MADKLKIITVYFEPDNKSLYEKLLNVFIFSLKKNMPNANLEIMEIPKLKITGMKHQAQMEKQTIWYEIAKEQKENYIMMDCDFIVMRDLSAAFEYDFDIAYTTHNQKIKPLNGGMIFGRPTDKARRFWDQWQRNCEKMYHDKNYWALYNPKYKGFAQVALGALLEQHIDCNIKQLPCLEWNACDEEWDRMGNNVRAVHIKGRLRKALFKGQRIPNKKVYDLWKQYEKESVL